jgi:hypothetical protein
MAESKGFGRASEILDFERGSDGANGSSRLPLGVRRESLRKPLYTVHMLPYGSAIPLKNAWFASRARHGSKPYVRVMEVVSHVA